MFIILWCAGTVAITEHTFLMDLQSRTALQVTNVIFVGIAHVSAGNGW